MENTTEVTQKTKNRVAIWSSNSTPGIYLDKTVTLKDTCTPVFIAALLTIASTGTQRKYPLTNEQTNVVHVYNGLLLSHEKEWKNATCSNTDGPRDQHAEWDKSERGRQTPYDVTYVWNLKRMQMNLFTTLTHKQTMVTKRERGWGGINKEFGISKYKPLYKTGKQQGPSV